MESSPGNEDRRVPTVSIRAGQLLRVRAVWVTPIAVTAVLVFLMTLFYVGSVVNPAGHLSGLPVLIADQDRGATVGSQHVDIGAEVVSALKSSSAVASRLSLDSESLTQATQQMDRNGAYATIVIPPDFTDSLLAAYDLGPAVRRQAHRATAHQPAVGVHRRGPGHRRGPTGPPRGVHSPSAGNCRRKRPRWAGGRAPVSAPTTL